MTNSPPFPFTAIVGQDRMKLALVLAAIDESLGGVLVRGTKGIAKSTAVRALAALLPEIVTVAGCPFNRAPGESIECWPLPADSEVVRRRVPLVEMPIGSTEDRVIGSINLERAIQSGQREFEPGLLAAANRGVLYIDEVNLLSDHLVDVLLDAAAMGTNRVEREGVSVRHPSRFVLVGTMNPEEGGLRPQLLDRFGLVVDAEDLTGADERAEAVRRRIEFDRDAAAFWDGWSDGERREKERIAAARNRLANVRAANEIVTDVAQRCLAAGADGLRGDLTLFKAARAHAAYAGRDSVTPNDLDSVAELALCHRRTRDPNPPGSPPRTGPRRVDHRSSAPESRVRPPLSSAADVHESRAAGKPAASEPSRSIARDQATVEISPVGAPARICRLVLPIVRKVRTARAGRRVAGHGRGRRGLSVGATRPSNGETDLALAATLRAAAPWQHVRGIRESDRASDGGDHRVLFRAEDIRIHRRHQLAEHLIVFVVDASRSMGALGRMRETKATILSLLVDAYQKRDRVALVTFRGAGAALALPPTRSLRLAERLLADLEIGGATPLAHGLALARQQVVLARRRDDRVVPMIVLVTDGRTNVALHTADPWRDARRESEALAELGSRSLVVDAETGPVRLGLARELAKSLGAVCYASSELAGGPLAETVRRQLLRSRAG